MSGTLAKWGRAWALRDVLYYLLTTTSFVLVTVLVPVSSPVHSESKYHTARILQRWTGNLDLKLVSWISTTATLVLRCIDLLVS